MSLLRVLALPLALLSAPALAATGSAADGLQAMRETNLIVLGDWHADSDVEGKVVVGGNASGGSASVGIGNASQGAASSASPTVTIAGDNAIGNLNVNDGSNGGNGTVAGAPAVAIGGGSGRLNLNQHGTGASAVVGGDLAGDVNVGAGVTLSVGGNLDGNLNGSTGGVARIGGQVNGAVNGNGASITQNLGIGFNNAQADIAARTTQMAADVTALSDLLAGLTLDANPSSVTANGGTLVLNAVDNGAGYALFNIDSSLFASYGSIDYQFASDDLPVIINVTGDPSVIFSLNAVGGATSDANQQVIWNFVDATDLSFETMIHGSVLATDATVTNWNAIEGTLVAAQFNQHGEVHLGTYDGGDGFLTSPPGVPEPASWAMMIAGLGLVGATLRRRPGATRTGGARIA